MPRHRKRYSKRRKRGKTAVAEIFCCVFAGLLVYHTCFSTACSPLDPINVIKYAFDPVSSTNACISELQASLGNPRSKEMVRIQNQVEKSVSPEGVMQFAKMHISPVAVESFAASYKDRRPSNEELISLASSMGCDSSCQTRARKFLSSRR